MPPKTNSAPLLNPHSQYDYMFAGTGAAALSLLMHMQEAGLLQGKKILLADRDAKNQNDRTWCFWETTPGLFEPIVYRSWNRLSVYGTAVEKHENIAPFTYKMIRGIDFYNYCLSKLNKEPGIQVVKGSITGITSHPGGACMVVDGKEYQAPVVFSSILLQPPRLGRKQHYLLQHFKGWIIETPEDAFDTTTATFMDFRVNQRHGATFSYVLPFTPRRALVEYTLFTENELSDTEYDAGLREYAERFLRISNYTVTETERGIIPMTDYRFQNREGNIVYTGTAGGNTRGSSGYTFRNMQQYAALVTSRIKAGKYPAPERPVIGSRARFYDSVLLSVLANGYAPGQQVFSRLFKKRNISEVLRFLDGAPGLRHEIPVILSQPKWPFIKAAFRKIF